MHKLYFFDTNIILKIYEIDKLFKIFLKNFVNNDDINSCIYITSITKNEFNIIVKSRNLFDKNKCQTLFNKLKIISCHPTLKRFKDDILYRDFINCPPHRCKMGRKDYQDNHRDTLIWLSIIEFVKELQADKISSFTFYTNDNDFLKNRKYLTDEFCDKTAKTIEFESFYPFEIFKKTYIETGIFKVIDFNDLMEWFSTFLEIIKRYDKGMDRNKNEVVKIIKLFLDPKIYKKHPVSYLLGKYKVKKSKDIESYIDNDCILFYKKITDPLFLKKIKDNDGKDIFDKNTISNIRTNFKYLHNEN